MELSPNIVAQVTTVPPVDTPHPSDVSVAIQKHDPNAFQMIQPDMGQIGFCRIRWPAYPTRRKFVIDIVGPICRPKTTFIEKIQRTVQFLHHRYPNICCNKERMQANVWIKTSKAGPVGTSGTDD